MSLPLNKTLQIWFKPATVSHKLHKTDYLYSNTFSFFHFHKDTQAWSCYFIIIESLLDTIWHINYRYTSQAIRSSDRKGLQQAARQTCHFQLFIHLLTHSSTFSSVANQLFIHHFLHSVSSLFIHYTHSIHSFRCSFTCHVFVHAFFLILIPQLVHSINFLFIFKVSSEERCWWSGPTGKAQQHSDLIQVPWSIKIYNCSTYYSQQGSSDFR